MPERWCHGDDMFVIGYDESTVMHKKRKCIHKRDKYFQSKIGKFLCQEPLKILDSVMPLLEGELHNSDNILYYYSQVDSLTIPTLQELLKKKKLTRYKRNIYNLYFTLTKKIPPRLSIRECRKAEMYLKLINKLYKKHLPNNRKSFLPYNFILQKILLVLGKVGYCRLIPNPGCDSTLTKLNMIWDRTVRDSEWVEALLKQKIV